MLTPFSPILIVLLAKNYKIRLTFLAPTYMYVYLNKSTLTNEWREYCLLDLASVDDSISIQMNAADFCTKVFKLKDITSTAKLKNSDRIPIYSAFLMPHWKKVFSKLKLIKIEHRNRLNTETIAALMATSSSIQQQGSINNFEPSSFMLNKKISTKMNVIDVFFICIYSNGFGS